MLLSRIEAEQSGELVIAQVNRPIGEAVLAK
jgi:hypothetical protein